MFNFVDVYHSFNDRANVFFENLGRSVEDIAPTAGRDEIAKYVQVIENDKFSHAWLGPIAWLNATPFDSALVGSFAQRYFEIGYNHDNQLAFLSFMLGTPSRIQNISLLMKTLADRAENHYFPSRQALVTDLFPGKMYDPWFHRRLTEVLRDKPRYHAVLGWLASLDYLPYSADSDDVMNLWAANTDESDVPYLFAAIPDDEIHDAFNQPSAVVDILRRMGDRAEPAIKSRLESLNINDQLKALAVIQFSKLAPELLPAVTRLAGSSDETVKYYADYVLKYDTAKEK